MQPYLLAALLALQAVAAPQSPDEQPSPEPTGIIVTDDGIELDTSFITEPFFEILSNYTDILNSTVDANLHAPVERLKARAPRVVTAETASKMKAPGHGAQGVFFRGDSRPPSLIFATGFQPKGSDPSLINHLSFAGNSGFVSLTRNPHTAEQYAFGRTGSKKEKGYIYVIAHKNVPDGYWLPGIYPPEKNPAVHRNQEFAVLGAVPAESISHAYEVTRAKPSARMTKIKNEDYVLRRSSSCFFSKRAIVCDPAKYMEKASKGRRIRVKISKTFRVSARAGGARWPNDVDRACARLRASEQPRPVETMESKRLKSVNSVLIACEKLENPGVSLATAELKAELQDRCEEFRAMAHKQDK
ncbi:hypothetical protein ACQRIT_001142 [Beauveria bassiana]